MGETITIADHLTSPFWKQELKEFKSSIERCLHKINKYNYTMWSLKKQSIFNFIKLKTIYDNQQSNVYTINELMSGMYNNDPTAIKIVDELITPNIDANKISELQNNDEIKLASNSLKQLLDMWHIKQYIASSKYSNPIEDEAQSKQIAEFVILSLIISLNTKDFIEEHNFDEYSSKHDLSSYNKSIITKSIQDNIRSDFLKYDEIWFGVFKKLNSANPKHIKILQIIENTPNVIFYNYDNLTREYTL